MSIMRMPASELLDKHAIPFKTKVRSGVTWFNLGACPVCGHNGFQCGISESVGDNGRLVHGFKCFHENITDYGRLLSALGYTVENAKASPLAKPRKALVEPPAKPIPARFLNLEVNTTLRNRLYANQAAMAYLKGRGLKKATIERFLLGLSKPFTNKEQVTSDNCLCFPLLDESFKPLTRYAYYNIPGVSVNPLDPNGWMKGDIQTYHSACVDGRKVAFVCEGAKDLWMLWQEIQGSVLADQVVVITSTHGNGIPSEWLRPEFWNRFETVFLGHDNDKAGEEMASRVAQLPVNAPLRVRVPKAMGKDWTDFFKGGGTLDDFRKLLKDAPAASVMVGTDTDEMATGIVEYNPVDINGAYHKGRLYYVTMAMLKELVSVRQADGSSREEVQQCKKPVVVRSDGALLSINEMPAPRGTPLNHRVLRLSDGTLIDRHPAPSPYNTWSWDSINAFHAATTNGGAPRTKSLDQLYTEIHSFLRHRVWLPFREDYALLSMAAIATYVQPVFSAVPLFLANGPKGSGKTEVGRAMCDVCANAALIGQASAATIARLIDMTRGFIVLDDLESVGRKKDDQFGELVQALKLSYKASTAVKVWTDVKTMNVEKLNFFGIKMINNTTGVDTILGSRMFTIQTRRRLPAETEKWESERPQVLVKPDRLRNDLHTWAFANVGEVDRIYSTMFPQSGERSDEIAAPLRTIAELVALPEAKQALEVALMRQANKPRDMDDPIEILEEALQNLVLEGFKEVTVQHVGLEMRKLVPDSFGQERTTDIPECFRPEWIGRTLKAQGWVQPDQMRRIRMLGMSLRALTVAHAFIEEVATRVAMDESLPPWVGPMNQEPQSFCRGCEGCPYRNSGCDLVERRQAFERAGRMTPTYQ